jgi:hypothetical protein
MSMMNPIRYDEKIVRTGKMLMTKISVTSMATDVEI